uniref:Uncharacterized protein n=1 Tax=Pyramimonas obovata TaxID=1411642 RepID=A0A7S0MRH7_9CHLO|mmetsp:Transcript_11661/g.24409  ORF Transcript_11661/g.24409 Transcript_11661/m.24409 type:complete len:319 (+) Transcript_11661:202-1158(+)
MQVKMQVKRRGSKRGRFKPAAWSVFKFPWGTQRKRAKVKRRNKTFTSDKGDVVDAPNGNGASPQSSRKRARQPTRDGSSPAKPVDTPTESTSYSTSPNPVDGVTWNDEFNALITQMVISESGLDALRECMKEWDISKLKSLVADWDATVLATVLDDFPSHKAATLLADAPASKITMLCDLWDVGAVKRLLPKLSTHVGRKVLNKLYFQSDDPHFTRHEVRAILERFDEEKREKLTREWSTRVVKRVMDSGGGRAGRKASVYDDDSSTDEDEGGDHDEDDEDDTLGGFIVHDDEIEYEDDTDQEQEDEDSDDILTRTRA